jgi:PAS domain S-box-containing protein
VNTYQLEEIIAEGPRTVLYRATAGPTRAPVVIKAVTRRPCPPRDLQRLENEFAIVSQLALPGVVPVLGLDTVNGMPALVLADTGARSLLPAAVPLPVPVGVFLPLALGIAEVVAALHARGVIHKDLKPDNILLHPVSGQVQLTDFGIASLLPREQASGSLRLIEGSLPYMAPEQTGWVSWPVDARSDLYALGVTFYQLLTGQLPFQASDPAGWVHCHVARAPRAPLELVPGLAPQLSHVVMKLLGKLPDERYQTAHGLAADLALCLTMWNQQGAIDQFPLGTQDVSDRFQVPRRIYGRDCELAALHQAFDAVVTGGECALLLVSGPPGSGKSVLVQELREAVARERGFFLAGKADQYRRGIPCATITEAFQELLLDLLSGSEASLAAWRDRLAAALGLNAQLVADLLPQLELLLGRSRPVPELPPSEALHRFHGVFRAFVGVFAAPERPLVLFLDDLQWADAASLELVEALLRPEGPGHLLIIAAYRDTEVGDDHPLMHAVQRIRDGGAAVRQIAVGPLPRQAMQELIGDVVRDRSGRAIPLATLVQEKTGGNPFFALQFVSALRDEELLRFAHDARAWCWDLDGIRAKGFTDNVVDFMVAKLRRFPARAQEVLRLAACLGNTVEQLALAALCDCSPETLRLDLWPVLQSGLLLPVGDQLRFAHDRVQQAAYALLAPEEQSATHLRVARRLLALVPPEQLEERVFDIANQFNLAADLLIDPAERIRVAELDLMAARKARAATAYRSGLGYGRAGCALLPAERWARHYPLSFALQLELAQCAYLSGEFAEADALLAQLLAQGTSFHDRALAARVRVDLYTTQARFGDACAAAIPVLADFGVRLELDRPWQHLDEAAAWVWDLLAGRSIEELLELPWMSDADAAMAMTLCSALYVPAYYTDQALLDTTVCEMMRLTLRYGNTEASSLAYAAFGAMIGRRFARYREGDRFGRLAHALVDRHGLVGARPRICNIYGHLCSFWARPYDFGLGCAREGLQAGIAIGDLTYACLCGIQLVTFMLLSGAHLQEVESAVALQIDFVRSVKFDFVLNFQYGLRGLVECLRGRTRTQSSFSSESFDEEQFAAGLGQRGDPTASFWYLVHRMQGRFIAGHHAEALAAAAEAAQHVWIAGSYVVLPEYHFYAALALAATATERGPAQAVEALAAIEDHAARLREWEANCPANFAGKRALVEAELARLRGERERAEELYDQAISLAHDVGHVQVEALACELAAGAYRARGRARCALAYLREAHTLYARWGALGKVRQLEQRYPELRDTAAVAPGVTFAAPSAELDLLGVLKASQSISQEMLLPGLCEKLMGAILEHGGATRATLKLARHDGGAGGADARLAAGRVVVRIDPAIGAEELPETIVGYVERTGQSVILEDAGRSSRFAGDPYLGRHCTRSVLCMPIARSGQPSAILYLENDVLVGAFTADRQLVLELLAAQAAISLENAFLYGRLSEQQRLLEDIIDNTTAVIYVKDLSGKVLLVNRKFEELVRVKRDQVAGKVDADLFPQELAEAFRASDLAVLRSGMPVESEQIVPHDDGYHTYLSMKFPLRDRQGNVYAVCGISTDITGRKRMEEQLRQAQKLESIGRLAGGVAHDFNNILTVIVGNAALAARNVGRPEAALSHVQEIESAAARASSLIRQLLAFARRQMIEPRVVELDALARDLALMLRRLIGEHIELAIDAPEPVWPVCIDPTQVEQLLLNLAVNARDAMPDGGRLAIGVANVSVPPRAADGAGEVAPGDYVVLEVRDTGAGMSAEVRAHLFEPFFTTRPQGQGTGLGLATCYGIVQQSGGQILCDSAPGRGTTFRIYLPRHEAASAATAPPPARPAEGTGNGGQTVLLVEDEPAVRAVTARTLHLAGYRVLEACDGREARQLFTAAGGAIALVVTDLVMPQLGGRALVEELRATRPELPVIFVSGYEPDFDPAALGPLTSFVAKPYRPDELASRVRALCDAAAARS